MTRETPRQRWQRMIRETDARMSQFNASLPSRDARLPEGIAWGLSIQDRLDRGKM